jgi:transposase-like protein
MKHNSSPFKWRHYPPELILLCVRWYCRYQLSYRDVEEMMRERGLDVDHSTVFRWVQRYAPEINKRVRQHLKMSGTSYRVDETYIKVGKSCKYLYRAVDKEGQTIEFMLSAKRDVSAAKRFFKKKVRASQCFKRFHTAERTLESIEAVNKLRKGQVKRLAGSDARGQAMFVALLFQIAA